MNNPERYDGKKDLSPFPEAMVKPQKASLENFQAAVDLIGDMHTLIESMNTERPADTSEFSFIFCKDSLVHLSQPDILKDISLAYGDLDEIQIDAGKDEDGTASNISIRFIFLQDDDTSILSVYRPGYRYEDSVIKSDQLSTNRNGQEHEISVTPITSAELSRCIASICFPSMDNDFSQFDALNLNSGDIYHSLIDLLQKHADYYTGKVKYDLQSDSTNTEGSLSYILDEGEVISAEIRQLIHSEITITDENDILLDERAIITEIDSSSGTSIQFYLDEPVSNTSERELLSSNIDDYRRTSDFINKHLSLNVPVQTESLQDAPTYDRPAIDE